ncbi:hypothetical protein EYF80_054330 [Liparis tanakae]|uniref:Uncharacterized protein n=1 Tax=Liparis tanakae TaxID=230148 RepID=A0A4Z2F2Y3_9TELE|nr:hypothetical protein EYF80_054330 [Liparis tanakae]
MGGWRAAGGGAKAAEAVCGPQDDRQAKGWALEGGPHDRNGALGDRARERKSKGYRGLEMAQHMGNRNRTKRVTGNQG